MPPTDTFPPPLLCDDPGPSGWLFFAATCLSRYGCHREGGADDRRDLLATWTTRSSTKLVT